MKFIFLGLLCAAFAYKDVDAANEGELTKMLLKDYVKTARPVVNVGEPFLIHQFNIHLKLNLISGIRCNTLEIGNNTSRNKGGQY